MRRFGRRIRSMARRHMAVTIGLTIATIGIGGGFSLEFSFPLAAMAAKGMPATEVNAWVVIHALAHRLGLPDRKESKDRPARRGRRSASTRHE